MIQFPSIVMYRQDMVVLRTLLVVWIFLPTSVSELPEYSGLRDDSSQHEELELQTSIISNWGEIWTVLYFQLTAKMSQDVWSHLLYDLLIISLWAQVFTDTAVKGPNIDKRFTSLKWCQANDGLQPAKIAVESAKKGPWYVNDCESVRFNDSSCSRPLL